MATGSGATEAEQASIEDELMASWDMMGPGALNSHAMAMAEKAQASGDVADGGAAHGSKVACGRAAERMVGLGFRCWARGRQTGDSRFFDVCSRQYIQRYGLKTGLVLATRLGSWVDALERLRRRPLSLFSIQAVGFSHDEVVAISMIAACQHAECPAMRACLFAITDAAETALPQHAAQDFADGLIDAGQILRPDCITYPLQHLAAPQSLGGRAGIAN